MAQRYHERNVRVIKGNPEEIFFCNGAHTYGGLVGGVWFEVAVSDKQQNAWCFKGEFGITLLCIGIGIDQEAHTIWRRLFWVMKFESFLNIS